MTAIEEWRPVVGVAGYDVSSFGRVRSWWVWGQSRLGTKPRLVALKVIWSGYVQVGLIVAPRRQKMFSVHRLVAEAFVVGRSASRDQVNHRDGNKANNAAPNLEWVSCSENHAHAVRSGLRRVSGDNHWSRRRPDAPLFGRRRSRL